MNAAMPHDFNDEHMLHDAELERLEQLAVASATLVAHAEALEDLEALRTAETERRAA